MNQETAQISNEGREDTLEDILERMHIGVARLLEERINDETADRDDIKNILVLLKQNNVAVKPIAKKVNHTNQLDAARRQAESAGNPFGRAAGE